MHIPHLYHTPPRHDLTYEYSTHTYRTHIDRLHIICVFWCYFGFKDFLLLSSFSSPFFPHFFHRSSSRVRGNISTELRASSTEHPQKHGRLSFFSSFQRLVNHRIWPQSFVFCHLPSSCLCMFLSLCFVFPRYIVLYVFHPCCCRSIVLCASAPVFSLLLLVVFVRYVLFFFCFLSFRCLI